MNLWEHELLERQPLFASKLPKRAANSSLPMVVACFVI